MHQRVSRILRIIEKKEEIVDEQITSFVSGFIQFCFSIQIGTQSITRC